MCWVKELKDPWRYTWAKLMLIRSIPTVVDTQIGKSNGKSLFNNNYRKLFPFVNKFPHVKNKRTENIYIYIPILNPLEPNLKKKKRGRGGFEGSPPSSEEAFSLRLLFSWRASCYFRGIGVGEKRVDEAIKRTPDESPSPLSLAEDCWGGLNR